MKKKVIIILDKARTVEEIMKGDFRFEVPDGFIEKVEKWFPEKKYDVDIYSRENFRNRNLNYIWMTLRSPVVIGYGYGAVYLEGVKNYSRKYLISPFWNENIRDSLFDGIDDYDKNNTFCFFGGNPKSLEMAKIYIKHYPKTFSGFGDGKLGPTEGIELCGMTHLFNIAVEQDLKNKANKGFLKR